MERTPPTVRRVVAATIFAGTLGAAGAIGLGAAGAGVSPFSDVPHDHQFSEDVGFMAATGIAGGYEDGTYRPGAPVTRQAMAAFIHRANSFEVRTTQIQVSNHNVAQGTAACDAGQQVIAGGGSSSADDVHLAQSRPTSDASGWHVRAESEDDVNRSWTTTVYAICGPVDVAGLS